MASLVAITSLMMHPSLPFEFFWDFWLQHPIDGIASEDELRALWLEQKRKQAIQ